MEKEKTIYCGSGKKQNDTWIKATINVAKIKEHIEEFQGNKFVRLNINVKDQPDQYGKDVSISVDKWKPEPKQGDPTRDENDLPF
jgi:hypothetical protein